MALIKWKDDFNINVDSIDQQHRKLVDMINDFYDEIEKKSNKELVADLIAKMKAYAKMHFATEEELLKKINYPNFDEHTQKHNDFFTKVNDLEDRFIKGSLILTFEITNFLKNWLINHIQQEDKEYAKLIPANYTV